MCSWKVGGGQGGPTDSTASGLSSGALWAWWGHPCPFWVPEHLSYYTLWERHAQHPFSCASWGLGRLTCLLPNRPRRRRDALTEGKLSYTVTKMQILDGNQVISS